MSENVYNPVRSIVWCKYCSEYHQTAKGWSWQMLQTHKYRSRFLAKHVGGLVLSPSKFRETLASLRGE